MKINIITLAATTALTAMAMGASFANNQIASTVETNGAATDFTFNGSTLVSDGNLAVTATGPSAGTTTGTFSFGPITETSAVSSVGSMLYADFSGGSFTIGPGLLTGTFVSSLLSSPNGSSASVENLALDNVTYTGGTYLSEFNSLYGGTGATGDLGVSLSSINPTLSVANNGYFAPFTAEGSVSTFDATPTVTAVPEPSPLALFAFGGFGLIGLMVRARKSRRVSGQIA